MEFLERTFLSFLPAHRGKAAKVQENYAQSCFAFLKLVEKSAASESWSLNLFVFFWVGGVMCLNRFLFYSDAVKT